ncbi:hypothetical protein F869_13317 [Klebsiella pneumoniae subsp. pneumoniae CIP 52.145 = B5055]|nr:hypothetical protein F869_13317 [Klebsiella pneumoniae subsp. pneumoniae CIP 52.145 = B5055]
MSINGIIFELMLESGNVLIRTHFTFFTAGFNRFFRIRFLCLRFRCICSKRCFICVFLNLLILTGSRLIIFRISSIISI